MAGMDVARLNLSHGDHQSHAENIRRIRQAAGASGKTVAILADLQGPKLRVGRVIAAGIPLREDETVTLITADIVGQDRTAIPVQYAGLPHLVERGNRLLLDDGLIELAVDGVDEGAIHCRVIVGGVLHSRKGINLPQVPVDLPSLTSKDREDLAFALEHSVDWIALSFVRSAQDLRQLRALVAECAGTCVPPVMAKIEKPQALENLDEIIAESDAVMVARGDLGIEMPPEQVPGIQKRIIRCCNRAGKPVITATQMLESMVRAPRPTRAEASDVANAVLDGSDAVMLSGETSIGAYPLAAVKAMSAIVIAAETEQVAAMDAVPGRGGTLRRAESVAEAVSRAAAQVARELDVSVIIAPTVSGYSARLMSRQRPRAPIVAVTCDPRVQRQLALYWGVVPLLAPRADTTDQVVSQAIRVAKRHGLVGVGDTVVVTAGAAGSPAGTTNVIQVHEITADGAGG